MSNLNSHFVEILGEIQDALSQISTDSSETLVRAILASDRIFIAGAGRSALVVKGFAMRLMHLGFDVYMIGEVTTPGLRSEDLLLIGSGSGATGSLLVMAQKTRQIGAKIALITTHADSPIGQLADIRLTIPAPTPKVEAETGQKSIQPMGTLFEQCLSLTLDALVMEIMDRRDIDSQTMFERHANLE
jgi:6-phospho-3-hexuloisomerase